jgi:hypothetical protein
MARYRNEATGVTVDVDEETAKLLGSDFKPADGGKSSGSKKASSAKSSDSDKK